MSCSTTLPMSSLNIGKIGKGHNEAIITELLNEFTANAVAKHINNSLSIETKPVLLG